jgi:exodeoxyribonuclease-3
VINKKAIQEFMADSSPDILCLNETKTGIEKIEEKKMNEVISEEYMQIFNCSKAPKGYSGVAIFSKIEPLQVSFDIDIPDHDQEGRVITAEFTDFYLVAVYVPNAGDKLKRHDYRVN